MGQFLGVRGGASIANVKPQILDIVKNAIAAQPYPAEIISGSESRGKRDLGNHGPGYAIDVQLYKPDANGKLVPLPNEGTAAYGAYEAYAQAARVYQQQKYPDLPLRSGLGFYTTKTSGVIDPMHLDIRPGGASPLYSWDKGGAGSYSKLSNGGLTGANGQKLVSQYQTALASGIPTPSIDVASAAPTPANRPNDWASAFAGYQPGAIGGASSSKALGAIQNEAGPPLPLARPVNTQNAGDSLAFNPVSQAGVPTQMLGSADTGLYPPMDAGFNPARGYQTPFNTDAVRASMLPPVNATGNANTSLTASGMVGGGAANIPRPLGATGFGNTSLTASGMVGGGSAALPVPASNMLAIPSATGTGTTAPIGSGTADISASMAPIPRDRPISTITPFDALYGQNPPTYASTGSLPDVPSWAMPSVPVSMDTSGMHGDVVHGAEGNAMQAATPALGQIMGGARSLIDNTTRTAALGSPPVSQTPASAYASNNSPLHEILASNNYGVPGYSGNTNYGPSTYNSMGVPTRTVTTVAINPTTGAPMTGGGSTSGALAVPPHYAVGSIVPNKDQSQLTTVANNAQYFDPYANGGANYGAPPAGYSNYGVPGYSGNDIVPKMISQQVDNPAYLAWARGQTAPSPFSNPGVQGLSPDDRQALNDQNTAAMKAASQNYAPPQKITRMVINPNWRPPVVRQPIAQPVAQPVPQPVVQQRAPGLAASGMTQPQYLNSLGYSAASINGVMNYGGAISEGNYNHSSGNPGGSSLSSSG